MFDNTVVLYLYSNTSSLGEHEIINNNNNNLTYAKLLNSSVVHEFTWIHLYCAFLQSPFTDTESS